MLGEKARIFKAYTLLACLQMSPTCMYFLCCSQKRDVCKMPLLIVFQPRSQGIQL